MALKPALLIAEPVVGHYKKVINQLKIFIDELNSSLSTNYELVETIFSSEYGYPEFDPLRDEICKCLICGLNQAAITLTNHLLEDVLKKCLIYQHTIQTKQNTNEKLSELFQEGINKFDNDKSDLSKSINAACSNGLIIKEHKKLLHHFRESFRNSYSHASSSKIFKDVTVKGKEISSFDEASGELNETFDVSQIPIIQGIIQYKLAKKESVSYFKNVDAIIRHMIDKLKNTNNEKDI